MNSIFDLSSIKTEHFKVIHDIIKGKDAYNKKVVNDTTYIIDSSNRCIGCYTKGVYYFEIKNCVMIYANKVLGYFIIEDDIIKLICWINYNHLDDLIGVIQTDSQAIAVYKGYKYFKVEELSIVEKDEGEHLKCDVALLKKYYSMIGCNFKRLVFSARHFPAHFTGGVDLEYIEDLALAYNYLGMYRFRLYKQPKQLVEPSAPMELLSVVTKEVEPSAPMELQKEIEAPKEIVRVREDELQQIVVDNSEQIHAAPIESVRPRSPLNVEELSDALIRSLEEAPSAPADKVVQKKRVICLEGGEERPPVLKKAKSSVEGNECTICCNNVADHIIKNCWHVFCKECLQKQQSKCCSKCAREFSMENVQKIYF
jgi:hypothetical protein